MDLGKDTMASDTGQTHIVSNRRLANNDNSETCDNLEFLKKYFRNMKSRQDIKHLWIQEYHNAASYTGS